jgi:3-methyladenine DNA glycosylase AlkD
MPRTRAAPGRTRASAGSAVTASAVVASLGHQGSKRNRDGMARYALPSDNAFGVSVAAMHKMAKQIGRNHELAADLWRSGWYEARMMACLVDDPALVTAGQMDQWAADFDSWGICDTACFHLFDRTPHAWKKVAQWSRRREEFVKRVAYALMVSLVVHDKKAGDEPYLDGLRLIERAATDDRNFVKKGVNWALRCIGKRNARLDTAAADVARKLAASPDAASRWIGKDALRELTSAAVLRRLERRVPAKA